MDWILMVDFNNDNAKIDAALKAQDSSISNILAARNAQAYAISYVGDGQSSRTFSFPTRPILLNIMGNDRWLCGL